MFYAVPQAVDLCGVIDVDGEAVGVSGAGHETIVDAAVSVALYLAAHRHRVVQACELVVTLCERSMIVSFKFLRQFSYDNNCAFSSG